MATRVASWDNLRSYEKCDGRDVVCWAVRPLSMWPRAQKTVAQCSAGAELMALVEVSNEMVAMESYRKCCRLCRRLR